MQYSTHFIFEAIGTHWEIDMLLDKKREKIVLQKIKQRVEKFDKSYSRFRADSLIYAISKNKGAYNMPADFTLLFRTYKHLNAVTHGLFTPLIGNTLESFGYGAGYSLKKGKAVFPGEFQDTLSYKDNTLTTTSPVILDFGAGGKGYLVDIVGDILKTEGIFEFLINAGGDILHSSRTESKVRIGLEDPKDITQVVGVAEILNNSICGSAGNRRKWENLHHIINPKTLVSPTHVEAVWITASTALVADSMATVLYLDQSDDAKNAYPCEYFILYADMTFEKSTGFDAELFLQ